MSRLSLLATTVLMLASPAFASPGDADAPQTPPPPPRPDQRESMAA